MKQTKTHPTPKTLPVGRETLRFLRTLDRVALTDVAGGAMHTSFSCGADLCTTHAPTG